MINRRKFVTPEGKIIETLFDVFWAAYEEDGKLYLYGVSPVYLRQDIYGIGMISLESCFAGKYNPPKDITKAHWYLDDNGKWIRR
jgi:hypothetical protein